MSGRDVAVKACGEEKMRGRLGNEFDLAYMAGLFDGEGMMLQKDGG